ncbi:MAG: hypothetical protein KGY61_07345 [Desulfobacterales bacterium]|nr:hypothetical protein [Desulfobacterales bacterium]
MQTSAASATSEFIRQTLPGLRDRYVITYLAEGDCIEYFLTDRATGEEISQNLVISLNRFARRIEIIRFYPELHRQPDTKFFSATCFYLLVHHFAQYFGIPPNHKVFVRTQPEVFTRFYQSLRDFDFSPQSQIANTIDLLSDFTHTDVDTSMIKEKSADPREMQFMIA